MFGKVRSFGAAAVRVVSVPVVVGVVFTPAAGVAFAAGREIGWFAGKESLDNANA